MYYGVDYYPEQWPYYMIDSDIERMLQMGVNVVRIGEFAWHIMEKEEGEFDFSFFDGVIQKLKENGIKVIFGTPTATPPAWLVKKHKDILSKDIDLMPRNFGGRREYCFNSKIYWEYTEKIVKKLLEHYRDEDAIISWQIDNEIGHEGSDMCYCETCHKEFQRFLKEKYKNIEDLNGAYGTVFWSHTYNDFDEVPIPLKTITFHNPALQLDYMRFRSESINNYVKLQSDLIKKLAGKNQIVTTNIAGGFFDKAFDHTETAKDLHIVSYDNYPVWGGLKEPIPPHSIAFNHDFIRGLKNSNFWIMEELCGAQGHTIIGYLPRPDQAKMWAYQASAHGAENILFFRWRGATFGTEEFCFGILDHDDKKGKKYYEVASFIENLNPYEKVLKSKIKSDIALVYDFENIWSWKIQPQSTAFDFNNEALRLYEPFYKYNTHIDVISSEKDFTSYKVLLIPVMMLSDKEFERKVISFVENGGTVIFSFRAGIKDRNNNVYLGKTIPCGFKDLCGIEVHEIESFQQDQSVSIIGVERYEGKKGYGKVWRDIIDPTTAKALYIYDDKFYKGKACITENTYGKGKVFYIGSGVDKEILWDLSLSIIKENKIQYYNSPLGVEVYERECEGKKYLFIMNSTEEEQTMDNCILKPYESKIIKKE